MYKHMKGTLISRGYTILPFTIFLDFIHRIIDDRIERYESFIVFFSK